MRNLFPVPIRLADESSVIEKRCDVASNRTDLAFFPTLQYPDTITVILYGLFEVVLDISAMNSKVKTFIFL